MTYLLLVAKLDKDVKNDIRNQHNSLQMHQVDDHTTSNVKVVLQSRKPYQCTQMILMQKKVRTNIQICVTCTISKIFDNYWSINYVKKKEIKQNIENDKGVAI